MSSIPKVSVLMPVYNSKTYLAEAIESILSQTFKDFELIIIIEFGTSDGSVEIIEKYALNDARIIKVKNDKRLGISGSLNKGIDMARGDYIARMDADDISLPDRFMYQVEFMDNNPHIGLSGLQPELFGEKADGLEWHVTSDPNQIKADLLFYMTPPMPHPTFIIRRYLLNKYNLKYNEDFAFTEDYEFLFRASLLFDMSNIISPILFKYRMHFAAATSSENGIGGKNVRIIIKNIFKEVLLLDLSDFEFNLLFTCIVHSQESNELFKQARKLFGKIIKQNKKLKIYNPESLLNVLGKKWLWFHGLDPNSYEVLNANHNYEHLLKSENLQALKRRKSIKQNFKSFIKRIFRPIYRKVINRLFFDFSLNLILRDKKGK